MPVKFTHTRCLSTSEEIPGPGDPFDALKKDAEQCAQQFRTTPLTPQSAVDLENALKMLAAEACRQFYECELNRAESNEKNEVPNKIRYHKETYRLNKKTPLQVATLFGTITLRSFLYLNETDGEPGLHPLRLRLGIGAGSATPALLEHAARLSVDHTQTEVRAWLLREHGLKWTPKTGQSNKLLLAVQERGNHGTETEVPYGDVQGPGGAGSGEG